MILINRKIEILLMICGILFVIEIFSVFLFYSWSNYKKNKADDSARAFITNNVMKTVSSWDKEQLVMDMSPILLKNTEIKDIFKMTSMFEKNLGNLLTIQNIDGNIVGGNLPGLGKVSIGEYIVVAKFEKGFANIRLRLSYEDNKWRILYFNVDSNQFLKDNFGQ